MKVLALNGSPRKRVSATFRILEALLAGMEDAGADTRLVHLAALDLRPCVGCYTCWVATPGACIHRDRDGMAGIMDDWRAADVVVFGTPLYHFSMTGLMKTFLDRLLPESEPWLVPDPRAPAQTTHPRRHDGPARAMLVSPCGFPDTDQFAPMVHTFRYIAERHHWTWMGELLRPGAEPLSRTALAPLFAPYLADVRRAGAALVREGRLPDALAEALGRDLFPGGRIAFYQQANRFWTELMARHGRPAGATPTALAEEDLDPADAGLSCRTLVAGMTTTFASAAAGDLDARIEFRIGGAEPGTYHLAVENGTCRFEEGPASTPTLTIEAESEVWTAIATGRRDGRRALEEGAYRARGDIGLLVRMNELFGSARP
ncbi:NAD(P)H-dependent oxidoreductase [Anaeromyxobacter terrae]|uniref:NAD(P)H-dependent oxidoreductase n=1 Tax=Anaeromyxobacter terrae TaxID=2925406 RepID=UPI001F58A6B7|nr:NAD(P)H-dependent oxidoreductase [Anaeromyxobacter sp. SG22]